MLNTFARGALNVLLIDFYWLLALSPLIFLWLRYRSSSYASREALISLSAPGAVAGLIIYTAIIADSIRTYGFEGMSHGILIPILIGVSGFLPACWLLPLVLLVSVRKRTHGQVTNVVFSVLCFAAVGLYFLTSAVARSPSVVR